MRRLLIADDDTVLRTLVSTTLASSARECFQARDGREAWDLIQSERPDVVILGLTLPHIGGLELCRRIKRDPDLAHIVVVVLTASPGRRAASLEAGAAAFLVKPFHPLELMQTIDRVFAELESPATPVAPSAAAPLPTLKLAAFMLIDIHNYTAFAIRHGDEAAYQLTHALRRVVKPRLAYHDGSEFKTAAEYSLSSFPNAHQAVAAAIEIIEALNDFNAANPDAPIEVGVGIDVGEPVEVAGDFFGTAVNRSARMPAVARPGEILVTETVRQIIGDDMDLTYVDRGRPLLQGLPGVQVYGLSWPQGFHYEPDPPPKPSRRWLSLVSALPQQQWLAIALVLLVALMVVKLATPLPVLRTLDAPAAASGAATLSDADVIALAKTFTVLIGSTSVEDVGLGSGVIYRSDGWVVTNAHVVPEANTINVALPDGTVVLGTVQARSEQPDLALIRIPGGPYSAARFADSDQVRAGEPVLFLGYPAAFTLKAQPSAGRGIISQTGSGLGNQYLQVYASMNPGVSGGPLLGTTGQLVGINVARVESAAGRPVQGIGFAIPSNLVRQTLTALERNDPVNVSALLASANALTPSQVVEHFYRFLNSSEFGVAYSLASDHLRAVLSPQEFAGQYGYIHKLSVQVFNAVTVRQEGDLAVVGASVLISGLAGDASTSVWHDQQWQLVREGRVWRLDALLSDSIYPGD